jgi:hypothetical protein
MLFMAAPASRPLTDVHAIMDDVDALVAAKEMSPDTAALTRQVMDTYRNLGVDVDPELVAQAVQARTTTAMCVPQTTPVAFDFGWDRPRTFGAWQTRLSRRQRVTQGWAKFLNTSSSVAFFCWLWIMLGGVPRAFDHPWLFAFACMGAGSVIEGYIQGRRHEDKRLDLVSRQPSRKTVISWQHSPRAQAYLEAMVASDVPLLKADVARLKERAQHDARMVQVRQGLASS